MVGVCSPFSGSSGVFYGDEEFVQNGTNTGNSCAYDANGNRLYDSNSNIWGINYNLLNLPDAMQFYQGHQTIYTYSATGAKLKVVDKTAPEGVILPVTSLNTVLSNPSVSTITTTDYVGNVIYENGTLKRRLTPEGYWQDGTYYYFLKDHLGSNRVVINSSGGIAETSSYYPSGMRFGESAANGGSVQPYRHTGHEMQSMHGLNWIDNLARFRTVSDGGGFTGVDPLAEKYYSISPYAYCAGNPVRYIDPNGKSVYGIDANGHFKLITINKDKTDQLYVMKNKKEIDKSKTFLTMSKNIMGSLKSNEVKTTDGKTAHYVSMHVDGNNKGAETAFKWLSNNTSVEWSMLNIGDSNTISTSHDSGSEIGGQAELLKSLSSGTKNATLDHSHPLSIGGTYPSGFGLVGEGNYGDKGNDKKAAQQIQSEYPDAKVTNRVYDQYLDDYIKYDYKGIIGY